MKNILKNKILSLMTAAVITASFAVVPAPAMAFDAPQPDTGAVGEISNGGEWTIYASKAGQIKSNSGAIEDATGSGLVEVTKDKRSAALQFDLSTKDSNDAAAGKVIKSAKLRLTPMVSKDKLKQTISLISNEFNDTTEERLVAEFDVPRVGTDDFNKTAALKELEANASISEYPQAIAQWQTDIDITGEVISADDDTLSLHVAYASGNINKSEYAALNTAENGRLKDANNPLPFFGEGASEYSKWLRPQIVFTYTDEADYVSAYNDFIETSAALAQAEITETETVSAPAVTGGSAVTLEAADNSGIVTVKDNVAAYNPSYAGSATTANIRVTVTQGEASYSKIVQISVDAAPSYGISFSTDKNPVGEISVTVGNETHKDGTAYAQEGSIVSVNAGANIGYTADIKVTTANDSEIEVSNSSFTMPAEPVNVSAEYAKTTTYGTSRIAAANSVSVQKNGGLQGRAQDSSKTLVIGADRITFVKFDLSKYNIDIISDAEISFNMAKASGVKQNAKAVFYVPNNDWSEETFSKDFSLNGDEDKKLTNFKYTNDEGTETTGSILGEAFRNLIIPNTDDASTAADGILKEFYIGSTGENKTSNFSITEALKTAFAKNPDSKVITLMVYSASGDGNDAISVQNASTLAERPSLMITESAAYLPDDELITEINTVEDFETFAAIVNGGNSYEGKTVTLGADIDLSASYNQSNKSWTPIGIQDIGGLKPFAGTFDGGSHTISGLYIDGNGITQGLFGVVTGTIKSLTVSGEINASSVAGGIAGWCSGSIIGCHSNVDIHAQREAGGIVGTLSAGGVISGSDNAGHIIIENKETYAGGITAHNIEGVVEDCINRGKVENGSNGFRNKIGGVVGFLDNGEIRNSDNEGEVVSDAEITSYIADTTQNYVGGIVGYSSYGVITNSNNSGRVYNPVDYAGGVAGFLQNGDVVSNCTNSGAVSGKGYVGGIVGQNDSSRVLDCRSDGAVSGTGNYIGGVAGYLSVGNLHNCSYDEELNSNLEIVGFNAAGTITNDNDPVITEYSVEYVDGNAKVSVKQGGKYTLIFAAYDETGALLTADVQTVKFENADERTIPPQNFNINENEAKTVKVMLWNSIGGMQPLCQAD